MKPKMVFILTPSEVIQALANYLSDERDMELENGILNYETNADGGVTIEVFEVNGKMELH